MIEWASCTATRGQAAAGLQPATLRIGGVVGIAPAVSGSLVAFWIDDGHGISRAFVVDVDHGHPSVVPQSSHAEQWLPHTTPCPTKGLAKFGCRASETREDPAVLPP